MQKYFDPFLYLVTDRTWLGSGSLEDEVEKAILGGVTMVQLREKNASKEEIKALAIKVKSVCKKHGIPLIINDFCDIAKAVGADGVHVGQSDESIRQARQLLGEHSIIGASAHNAEEAIRAQNDGADYLGAGAVFGSSTKTDAGRLTVEGLSQITTSVSVPTVAIGGINKENIQLLKGTGIKGVAVVSAILHTESPQQAAQTLTKLLKETVTT